MWRSEVILLNNQMSSWSHKSISRCAGCLIKDNLCSGNYFTSYNLYFLRDKWTKKFNKWKKLAWLVVNSRLILTCGTRLTWAHGNATTLNNFQISESTTTTTTTTIYWYSHIKMVLPKIITNTRLITLN